MDLESYGCTTSNKKASNRRTKRTLKSYFNDAEVMFQGR